MNLVEDWPQHDAPMVSKNCIRTLERKRKIKETKQGQKILPVDASAIVHLALLHVDEDL